MEESESRFFSNKINTSRSSMTNKNHNTKLQGIYEPFEELLRRVLQTKSFGVTRGTIELVNVTSSHGNGKADRFYLSIPYAKQSLLWTVLFNATCPDLGPDFEFSDKSFLADPSLEDLVEHVPSLTNWNRRDPDCLLKVLTELVVYYRIHQISRLQERLQMEHSSLVEQTEICDEDIEMILLPNSIDPAEAHFLIRIAMDFTQLPGRSVRAENDAVMLHVAFYGSQWNRIVPQLFLSSSLQDIIGNPNTLHIPPFPVDKTLMDYVPEIKDLIDEKISAVVANFTKKKAFVSALLAHQGGSIIEYDAIDFTEITLLLSHQDFFFLLHINLSTKFPTDIPKFTMESVYHFLPKDELFKYTLPYIPWSPRWEPALMVTKTLSFIMEKAVQKFKDTSTRIRRF